MLCVPPENVSNRGGSRLLRTCVACGRKASRDTLARVIRTPSGDLLIDWRRHLRGRGAHVCPSRPCIERAVSHQLFHRAFKGAVKTQGPEVLIGAMRTALLRQIETLIRSGAGARLVTAGTTAVDQAFQKGTACALLAARDSARLDRTVRSAARAGVPICYVDTKAQLGAFAGRSETSVMAVLNDKLARTLCSAFERLEMLK